LSTELLGGRLHAGRVLQRTAAMPPPWGSRRRRAAGRDRDVLRLGGEAKARRRSAGARASKVIDVSGAALARLVCAICNAQGAAYAGSCRGRGARRVSIRAARNGDEDRSGAFAEKTGLGGLIQ
jgi:hypothetical protein